MNRLDPSDIDQYSLIVMILLSWEAKQITTQQAERLTGYSACMLRDFRASVFECVQRRIEAGLLPGGKRQ